jgi:hypothetical protein
MSDFLSNLAATTLQVASIAQPRLPALFEPRTLKSDAPPIESNAVYSVDVPAIQSSSETHRTERENFKRSTVVSRSKANTLESTSRTDVTTLRAELQPATMAARPMAQTEPVASTVSRPRSEPPGQLEQSELVGAAPPAVETISTFVSTSPRAVPSSPVEVIHPKIERQTTQTQISSEPSEPRIHISIGRIEVRAASATAPARAIKREAAVLGLDDYLRQRR